MLAEPPRLPDTAPMTLSHQLSPAGFALELLLAVGTWTLAVHVGRGLG